ncbi:MAG: HAMP domain-containing protein [Phyllobacteriaceae bacterium]|nr:HAMP domain-containing protein [Phyllobacteriaceae bacterium]
MRRRHWSLRRRLGIGLVLAVSVLWLAAATVAGLVLRREIDEVFDSALQEVAQRILPLAYSEFLSREAGDATQHLPPIGPHREFITYVVRDQDGKVLLQSSDAEPARVPVDLPSGFATEAGLRFYTEAAVRGTIVVTTIEDLRHRRDTVGAAVEALVWPLAALVPVALLAVFLLGRASLKPILSFRRAIAARGRGNLSALDVGDLPDEIAPIAVAVDALIARLRNALEAERSFTANAAHELRTPLAAALAQTQRLLSELTEDKDRDRARAVVHSLRRLSNLAEKLLQLAKAEGGGLLAETASPLAPVLRLVIEEIDRRFDVADRLVVAIECDGGRSDVDPDAFAILARNLIENALKHGTAEGPVVVRLRDGLFEVENDAPPTAPERLASLTRRFERGATTAEGAGLGLAIASAVCAGVGTTLELTSPVPGRADGFLARIRLPVVGQES